VKSTLSKWLSRLAGGTGNAQQQDLASAAAVILYEIAISDYHVAPQELAEMQSSLAAVLGLDTATASDLLEEAEASARHTTSLHPFTRAVNDALDSAAKQRLMEALWRVAYADGRVDRYEEHYLRKIADLLYIPHSTFIRAKLAAGNQP
jgi:uncharacterized tellurite resistance protein B-like protein